MKKCLMIFICVLAHTQFYAQGGMSAAEKALAAAAAVSGNFQNNVTNNNMGVVAATAGANAVRSQIIERGVTDPEKLQVANDLVAGNVQGALDNGSSQAAANARGDASFSLFNQGIPPTDPRFAQAGDLAEKMANQFDGAGELVQKQAAAASVTTFQQTNNLDQAERSGNLTGQAGVNQLAQGGGWAQSTVAMNTAAEGSRKFSDDNQVLSNADASGQMVTQNFANDNGVMSTVTAATMGGASLNQGQSFDKANNVNNLTANQVTGQLENGAGLFAAGQGGVGTAMSSIAGQTDNQAMMAGDVGTRVAQNSINNGQGEIAAGAGAQAGSTAQIMGNPNSEQIGMGTADKAQGFVDQGVGSRDVNKLATEFGNTWMTTGNEQFANQTADVAMQAAQTARNQGLGDEAVGKAIGTSAEVMRKQGTGEQQAEQPQPVPEQQPPVEQPPVEQQQQITPADIQGLVPPQGS